MKKRLTMILASLFLIAGTAMAQMRVTGTVTSSEDGEPVVGASVKVVGTNTGTATDVDGKFTLTVSENVNLVFSYIGMQDKTMKAQHNMKVVLNPDDHSLDEVMVVAFGTQKKSAFTGSAAVVNSDELSKKITTNVADALVGSVPGLQMRGGSGAPGSGAGSINIRGIASLYSSTDPLVIVDGAPYSASLSNISQDDIESISVLKDAASAALYGARGAAGVIIITTKRGNTKDAIIKADMKWGSNSRAIQDYKTIDNAGEYYQAYYSQLYNKYFYNDGMSNSAANKAANDRMLSDLGYNVYTVPTGENLIGMNGLLNPNATLGRSYSFNGETYYMTPDNWSDEAYSNALRQEYNVSVSGGNTKSSFYASAGYLNEDGIIEYSGFERITARVKADYQARKWLKVGANIGYVHSTQTSNPNLDSSLGSSNLMYYTSSMAPIYPIYVRVLDANGKPVIRTDANGNKQYDFGVAASNYGVTRPFMATGNPLGSNFYNSFNNKGNQLNGTFTADIDFTSYLKANITSNVNWGETQSSTYESGLYGSKVSVGGQLTKSVTTSLRTNNTQTLTYYKTFGKHDVNVMVGHEYYLTSTRFLDATGTGSFSLEIPELNAFATKTDSHSYTTKYNVEGYFGSAQYNYDQKYFGSLSYRRDASSRFAKENRWGNFWSVGGAWIMSKEDWFNAPFVDMLKLKLSVGQQGNDGIGNWNYIDLYTLSNSSATTMAPSFSRLGNKDISWETTTNFNVGLEFALLKNRLTGNLDVYSKKVSDLLFWMSVPESAGARGYYTNIGDIRNTGLELTLTGEVIRTKDVNWSITASLSHNATKILKLPAAKIAENGGFYEGAGGSTGGNVPTVWYEEGKPMYNVLIAEYAGVNDKGEALYWVDEDMLDTTGAAITNKPGKKHSYTTTNFDSATRYTQGSILPKVTGGFSTSIRVGDFDASASFDYQIGGKVYDAHYADLMTPCLTVNDAGHAISVDVLNAWTPNNTNTNIPRWQYGDKYTTSKSTRFLTNAGYLNFQSFTLGYSIPKNITKKWNISKLRFYVAGENLLFWSARQGFDPRYSFAASEYINTYSPVRNISGGVQVTL